MFKPPEYTNLGGGRLDINPRQQLLARRRGAIDPIVALDDLHQKLATATVIYEQHGDGGRAGAWRALTAVIDALRTQGLPVAALLPLSDLAIAMHDADRGISTPLLDVKRGRGKPPKSSRSSYADEFLAVIMECCVRIKREQGTASYLEAASRMAAKLVAEAQPKARVSTTRMREVREMVSQLKPGDPKRQVFDDFLREAAEAAEAASLLSWVTEFTRRGWVPMPEVSG